MATPKTHPIKSFSAFKIKFAKFGVLKTANKEYRLILFVNFDDLVKSFFCYRKITKVS